MKNQGPAAFISQNHKEQFQIRLLARLFIIGVLITQAIQRIIFSAGTNTLINTPLNKGLFIIDMATIFIMIVLLIIERIIYAKKGPLILRYTNIIDGIFFVIYVIEWLATYYTLIDTVVNAGSKTGLWSVFAPVAIVWRTLLQNFIVRRWYLRCIAPIATMGLFVGFLFHVKGAPTHFIIIRGVQQIAYLLIFFYFEDKVNVQLFMSNIHQGKWLQINQFILDNIPENIAIFDWTGEFKYKNNYFQQFLHHFSMPGDEREILRQIKSLERSDDVDMCTWPGMLEKSGGAMSSFSSTNFQDIIREKTPYDQMDSLEVLIKSFKQMVSAQHIQEKSFIVYNGTLHYEDQERAVEVKVSFIQQELSQYVILILRDTTQRDLVLTLESNNKYKDKLLASVSHELRAPLNGTINLLEAAVDSPQMPSTLRDGLLEPALRSSKYLLHLINDILDMSQISAQKLRLIFRQANLQKTIVNSIKLVELQAKKKGINLEMEFDPSVPSYFCTDHVRLSQIVLNLVNNALKFTQEGFVRITVTPFEDPNSNCVKIVVEDSGVGMAKEDLAKLFKAYTHIDSKDRCEVNPSGVGLGLNIAKNLAELLGPKDNKGIVVKSKVGKGSKFCFLLENKEADLKMQKRETSTGKEESSPGSEDVLLELEPTLDIMTLNQHSTRLLKHPTNTQTNISIGNICSCPKILVVDDDLFNILAYETILNSLGFPSDCAFNGKLALDKLLHRVRFPCGPSCKCYTVVFMDQEMPQMNGIEAVKEIRRLQEEKLLPDIKIIGCTAHKGEEEAHRFYESGINEWIEKPVSKSVITNILEAYLPSN